MSVKTELEEAIINRQVVRFVYDGLQREVELGTTTAGRPALRAYQTAGGSRSGTVPGWHLFSLDKIGGIAMIQESFSGERPWYNPVDKAMSTIGPHV